MKRVITVLLAVLLALSLAACGSRVETKKLAGTWTCTIDVTDRMNAAVEQALGLSAADGAAKMPLQLVLTVTEDGAYTLRYDSDAVRTALDAYAAALHPAAVESVYAAAEEQGFSREEYDAAMEKAGLTIDDIDLVEANEAFAAQSIAVARELGFDMSKVNVNGGAISIGHPVGASGARIIVTLLHEMLKRDDAKKGLATLCIGGGQGVATIFEKC